MRTAPIRARLVSYALLLLCGAVAGEASATVIQDDTIVGTTTHDFEAVGQGVLSTLSLPGATYGERFSGQTVSPDVSGFYDALSGTPTSPLTLLAGAPGFSLAVTPSGTAVPGNFLAGCGPFAPGCPGNLSVGEGAVSVLFGEDMRLFGIEVLAEGGEGAELGIQFFSRAGALLGAFTIPTVDANTFLGFRVVDGDSIAGVSLTNTDPGGVGYDSVTFSTIPEPSTAVLLLLGLSGLRLTTARRRSAPLHARSGGSFP